MKLLSYAALTLTGLLIVGCGGGTSAASNTGQGPSQESAGQVVKRLQAAGVPIDTSQELTAANDPNELLGRPGHYIGKALFHDTRLSAEKDSLHPGLIDADNGGSVEIFDSEADAQSRAEYVRAITEPESTAGVVWSV